MFKSIRFLNLLVLFLIWAAPRLHASDPQPTRPVTAPKPAAREYYLGVFTDPVPKALAYRKIELLGESPGVLVTIVLPNSPADKAGLKPNDILIAYGDQKLSSPQQLKRLVVSDTLSRPVTVQIVRGEKSRSVDVHLAERVVNWTHGLESIQVISVPRVVRLMNRGGVPVFIAHDGMLIPGSVVPWKIRTVEIASPKHITVEVKSKAILISTTNGSSFQLEVSQFNKNGRTSATHLEGTSEEIQLQIQADATIHSDDVKTVLDWAKSRVKRQRGIQIRFQSCMDGTKRGMRILMSRPEGEQTIRCLQCDHYFDENQPMDVAVLLSAEPLLSELSRLHPIIRQKVESTLLNAILPVVSMNVERSQ